MRLGDWVQTYSGRAFYPLDPRPEDICIEDVAHHLSLLCRYGGACRRFYSVAEHSILVSQHVPAADALWGLLHDASEAYVVDVPRPLKRDLAGYKSIEHGVMSAVVGAFGLDVDEPESVRDIDARILLDEAAALMAPAPQPWRVAGPPVGAVIVGLTPEGAERAFLARFHELIAGRSAAHLVRPEEGYCVAGAGNPSHEDRPARDAGGPAGG